MKRFLDLEQRCLFRVQDMLERSRKPKRGKVSYKPCKKDRRAKLREELQKLLAREKVQVADD